MTTGRLLTSDACGHSATRMFSILARLESVHARSPMWQESNANLAKGARVEPRPQILGNLRTGPTVILEPAAPQLQDTCEYAKRADNSVRASMQMSMLKCAKEREHQRMVEAVELLYITGCQLFSSDLHPAMTSALPRYRD